MGNHRIESMATEESIADAGSQPPGPPLALFRGGAGFAQRYQPVHAPGRIKLHSAGYSAVNHDPDTFDSQAGLGNAGCQHDFSLPTRLNSFLLFIKRQVPVKLANGYLALRHSRLGQPGGTGTDFTGTGQKGENISFGLLKRTVNGSRHPLRKPGIHLIIEINLFHRI